MATPHYKLSRKELKQPDEFLSIVDRAARYAHDNFARVILGAVAVIALVAVVFAVSFYLQHQRQIVAEKFYQALTALGRKDYTAAEQGFSTLAQQNSGSNLGRLANFYLASAYIAQSHPDKARKVLNNYLEVADQTVFKQMALTRLGALYENSGEYRKANEVYVQAAALEGPEQARAQLGNARTLALQGQKQGAIAAYQGFLRDNPFALERMDVIEELAQMGVAPTQTASSKTNQIGPAQTVAPTGASSKAPQPSSSAPAH